MLKTVLICSFDIKGIINNGFVPPEHSAFKFWNVYTSVLIAKDQIFSQANEFCIMTMHLPT
jgi:hypothetical protein